MSTQLTIDCGNSASKIVVWEDNIPVFRQTLTDLRASVLTGIIRDYSPKSAIVCSVKADSGKSVWQLLRKIFPQEAPVMKLTQDTPVPIRIDYDTPTTLGVDRIAAAVGAYTLAPEGTSDILIADIGTAVTYDLMHDGCFVGGNIAPGIGMRLRALHGFTARLPLVDSKGPTLLFGTSTESAMRAGAVNGVVAELNFYKSQLPPSAVLFLTGGWSADIAVKIPRLNPVTEPLLVSFGLNRILSYNENL